MSETAADGQTVLRCAQCNKPFDKQSTLKRHFYYCRSRKTGNTGRARSCIPCAKGKVACDNSRPQCSRCVAKSLDCRYPCNASKIPKAGIHRDGMTPAPLPVAESPLVTRTQDVDNLDDMLNASVADLSNLGDGDIEWDNMNISFADFLNTQITDASASSSSLMNSTPLNHQATPTQQHLSPPRLSIPITPTSGVRSLLRRPRMPAGAQRTANLILHTLKSYPFMMLRHNTLPPFIHPATVSSGVGDSYMEPLTNCISLVHMMASGVQGSRKLFWQNVRTECERLFHKHKQLHKWELLAAMQALSIYILIRLDESETEYDNSDALLIKTVIAIAQQLSCIDIICHDQCGLCNKGLQFTWREWIFRESRRRLAIIYRVVNLLIYFEPVAMCTLPSEFILAPLPANKQLWEAADEFRWKEESQNYPGSQVSFGLAADGSLVELDEGRLSCSDAWLSYQSMDANKPPSSTANWEEWCAGIDGFGGLVMLAASLVV
ncbi:hypothetical protein GGR55DRAFT_622117 [Xylaria sp. FL0064]|nr:hypothetical protein GGR55DRAFT_622117 [Xylaria sp. FL0064]